VNEECLRLTSYFGGRPGVGSKPAPSALIDLFERQEIAVSMLMQGSRGFGLSQHLRAGRFLSLTEDLPLVAAAVDLRSRIEAVLEQTMAFNRHGLVTLEKVTLLTDDAARGDPPADLPEQVKLTGYLGRREQVHQIPAFEAICDLLYRRGVAGATALLGRDGTVCGQRPRGKLTGRNAELPMMVIAVGDGRQIASVVPDVAGLLRHPILTLSPVKVCKRDGMLLEVPELVPQAGGHGTQMSHQLTVYSSQAALHDGAPIHRVLADRLLSAGVSGMTTVRGVWGFQADQVPHGDRWLHAARHVPAVTVIVDTPERAGKAFAVIDELTEERGLVTSETVTTMRAVPAGQ
jgi:PII-like signaling protein